MTTDAWLAIAHHLGVFSVAAVLAAEWALVRPGLQANEIRRLARIDSAYGAFAALVIAAGVARVFHGAKPASLYTENTMFWLKMAAFAAVGLLSIRPTLRYLQWRKAVDADETATPAADEVTAAHRTINVQLTLFASIPILAALMARGISA